MKIAKIIDSDNFVINAGGNNDIKFGDKFVIYLLGDEVFDPETGKSIGVLELPKLHCHATHVQDTMSIIRSDEAKPKGGVSPTISLLKAIGASSGDSSPYNFLSENQRTIQVGDLVRKIDK